MCVIVKIIAILSFYVVYKWLRLLTLQLLEGCARKQIVYEHLYMYNRYIALYYITLHYYIPLHSITLNANTIILL